MKRLHPPNGLGWDACFDGCFQDSPRSILGGGQLRFTIRWRMNGLLQFQQLDQSEDPASLLGMRRAECPDNLAEERGKFNGQVSELKS